jgi:uncharacterized sulfatase
MSLHSVGAVTLAASFLLSSPSRAEEPAARPNILWITCEDICPNLGCYGDRDAYSPNLDALAKEAVRFTHAFSVAGVCAPSRSCLITGLYPSSLGSHWMRCKANLPAEVKCFTEYLREVGYYCSNNSKEDYNFTTPKSAWDESSRQAHWRKRKPGQPFFSVFNILTTHESQIRAAEAAYQKHMAGLPPEAIHDPAKVAVPPFHPDTPLVRRDWARYHDLISAMDREASALLKQLADDKLADDTIVFFFSDHGVGLPRGKRWLYDTGMHVPLLVRFPAKWQKLAPGKPGTATDRLVSFVDFGPTLLSLAGVKPPEVMQGVAFLGPYAGKERDYVYGIRDRMDERYDFTRAVRDRRYKYLRNYLPHLPWAQPINYMDEMPTTRELRRLSSEGKLQGAAALWMRPTKPPEELYDCEKDPHEIHNLADSDTHREVLERLRDAHTAWVNETRDLGFLTEAEIHARCKALPPFELARKREGYDLRAIRAAADTASQGARARPQLRKLLASSDSGVRYWAVAGLLAAGKEAKPAEEELRQALKDPAPSVRLAAAEALMKLDQHEPALAVLRAGLKDENPWARLEAMLILDRLGEAARPAWDDMKACASDKNEYVVRVLEHARQALEK